MTLRLKIKQLRKLELQFGLSNFLKPSAADTEKMLSLDFLVAAVSAGLEYLPPKERPDVEEMELSDLLALFKGFMEQEPGKPEEKGRKARA